MGLASKIFKSPPKADGDFFLAMKQILGFKPKEIEVYKRAFLHRSLNKKDDEGNPMNYERLEFLGDAMLGTIISKHLYIVFS
mgnify:FL=1